MVRSARREKTRWAAVIRLAAFLVAVGLFAFASLLHSVRADVTEVFLDVGSGVMDYPGASNDGVRELVLNGVSVSFRTQMVDASLTDVLGHYQNLCTIRDGGLSEQLSALSGPHLRSGATPLVLPAMTTQAAHNDRSGYVACLDMGDAPRAFESLGHRFLRFTSSGDLSEVGSLRYVFASRAEASSGNKTFVFTMWVDSGFDVSRILPAEGTDAEGSDLVGVPRLPSSQRILFAWESGQPSGVTVYRVAASSAREVESFYRSELPKNGWTIIERHASESVEIDGAHVLSAEREGRAITIVSHTGEDSQTFLTVLASEPS